MKSCINVTEMCKKCERFLLIYDILKNYRWLFVSTRWFNVFCRRLQGWSLWNIEIEYSYIKLVVPYMKIADRQLSVLCSIFLDSTLDILHIDVMACVKTIYE